jgi:hypothetical protein
MFFNLFLFIGLESEIFRFLLKKILTATVSVNPRFFNILKNSGGVRPFSSVLRPGSVILSVTAGIGKVNRIDIVNCIIYSIDVTKAHVLGLLLPDEARIIF